MSALNLIYSFRARLLVVLAVLLVSTLGVQYLLNLYARRQNEQVIAEQEQALAAGISLALESFKTKEYLGDIQERSGNRLLEKQADRVKNILIVENINGEWLVTDSLDQTYLPVGENKEQAVYWRLENNGSRYVLRRDQPPETVPLPPFIDVGRTLDEHPDLPRLPLISAPIGAGVYRAVPIPVHTGRQDAEGNRIEGITYIIVVLGSAAESMWQAALPLLATLTVMLGSMLLAAVLVWRFTQPIKYLSEGAKRVAAGDFNFRVPAADRRDEMGTLAAGFNDMVSQLAGLRELQARLHQAERSAVVGRLASAIAHEIRNPLNYINLTLDHMRTSLAPEDAKKRELFGRLTDQVKTEVARINTRISEFLNYSRPSRLALRPLDLRATVEDALRMVEVQAAESGITTQIEQKGSNPTVPGDAESLRSVFTNLIINGMQSMEGGGRLTITLSTENGHARVDVTDTGHGIAPEHLPQIFEPYFSTKETGTGLGLAIVKKVVDDHGGAISVQSLQGRGTTFTIRLPIAER